MDTVNLEGSVVIPPADAATAFGAPLDNPQFSVIDTPTIKVMDPVRGRTFDMPQGLTSRETDFLLQRSGDKKPPESFIGPFHMPDAAKNAKNGFLGFFAALPQVPATLKKEFGQRFKVELSQPLGYGDFLNLVNPLANDGATAGSMAKISDRFFGGGLGADRKKAEKIIKEADSTIKRNQLTIERLGLARPKTGGVFYDIGAGGATIGGAVFTTVLTRSPAVAAAFFGILQKTSIYRESINSGKDPVAASRISDTAGAVEGAVEAIGGGLFLKMAALDKPLKRIIARVVEESAQEAAQQGGEEIITQSTGVRNVDVGGGIGRVAYSAALGALLSGPVSVAVNLVERTAKEEGVDPKLATIIASNMRDNRDQIVESAAGIIKEINSDITIDPKAQKEVSDIIKKFTSGETIDVGEVLKGGATDVTSVLDEIVKAVEVKKDISSKVAKGRLRELEKGISTLDNAIAEIDSRIKDREQAGRPVKALQNKMERMSADRTKLETEQADISFVRKKGDAREALDTGASKEVAAENKKINDLILQLEHDKSGLDADLERARTAGDKALINRVNRKRTTNNAEIKTARAELAANEAKFAPETASANKEISVKATVLESLNKTTTRESIRAVRKGFRAGMQTARKNIKDAQTALVTLIKKSGLTQQDQAKFISAVKNIRDPEHLQRQLPGIQSRVINLLGAQRKREIRGALKKIVKRSKASRSSGKRVGRLTPQTQQTLDHARSILSLSKSVAEVRLEEALSAQTPSPDAAFENRLLAIAARSEDISIGDMEQALVELAEVRAEGIKGGKARLQQQREKVSTLTATASDAVTQGKDIDASSTTSIAARARARAKTVGDTFSSMWAGWNEILDIVINKKGVNAGPIIKALTVTREIQARKKLLREWGRKFTSIGMEAFGFRTQKQLMDRLARDSVRHNLGAFTDVEGRERVLEYSAAEARKLWMEAQDPTIADTITDPNGNAFSDEMLDGIFGLLGQEDIAYARAQMDFYQQTYGEVNAVYARIYGLDLPTNPFYTPIQRDRGARPVTPQKSGAHDDITATDNFLHEQQYRRSVSSSSLKGRVKNVQPLKRRDDTAVMTRYMHDMAHFITMAEKARLLNAVFGSQRLRKEITASHSGQMLRQIDSFIEDVTRGYLARGKVFEDGINFFNRNFARSVLALKPQIGIKQLTSVFAYAENISPKEFMAGILDFAAHPKESAKTLFELSPLLQQRGSSEDIEISKLSAGDKELLDFRRSQSFENMLSVFIRYGDRAPIYLGGWAVYRAARKAGKSKAEAIAEVEAITASTQQSSDVDQLSVLQRSGPFGRTLSMFMSAPMALMRGEMRAIRHFRRGKINAREFGKRMAIYHILIPMAFQFAASGLRFEPDKQLVAFALGSFNGLVILGDVIKNILYDLMADKKLGFGGATRDLPIADIISKIFSGVSDAFQATDGEEFTAALKDLSIASGEAAGLPVKQGFNFVDGANALADGEKRKGTLLIMGWPESVATSR